MRLTVEQIMAQGVVVAQADHSVDYVRRQMRTLQIHAVPVADGDGRPVGIVRARDLLGEPDPATPVAEIMCREPVVVTAGVEVQAAADLLRRRRHQHLVVVENEKIVGIVSAFDFLELVAGHRFEMVDEAPEFRTGIIEVPKKYRRP